MVYTHSNKSSSNLLRLTCRTLFYSLYRSERLFFKLLSAFMGFKRFCENIVLLDEEEKGGVSKLELIAVFSVGTILIKMGFLHLYLDHLNQLFLVSNWLFQLS